MSMVSLVEIDAHATYSDIKIQHEDGRITSIKMNRDRFDTWYDNWSREGEPPVVEYDPEHGFLSPV
jgi:hypothetical protein